jgi:hypothetical protein
VIIAIPTELNGTKPVPQSRSSQASSQADQQPSMNSSADQGNSFQSFLHTAAHQAKGSEDGEQRKPESKPDPKNPRDNSAGRQDQHDRQSNLLCVEVPPQVDAKVAIVQKPVAPLGMAFDLTKGAGSEAPSALPGTSRIPASDAAEAFIPKAVNTLVRPISLVAQPAQPSQASSGNSAPLNAVLVPAQASPQSASSSQSSVPDRSAQEAGPVHLDANVAASSDAAVNAAAVPVSTEVPLAVEAGLQFRLPKVQAMMPMPGTGSAAKAKGDHGLSSGAAVDRSNGAAPSPVAEAKSKDQHGHMDSASDGNSGSTGQQMGTSGASANPAAGQNPNTHVDASAFQAAIPASSSRHPDSAGNSQLLKAATPQPMAPSAPTVAAAEHVQDLQAKVDSARLVQSVHDSELRVGVRSGEFGDIAIHTSVSRNAISAQISVEHGELAKAIASSLPELRSVLGNHDHLEVRVAMHEQVSPQMDFGGRGAGQGTQREWKDGSNSISFQGDNSAETQSAISAIQDIDTARPAVLGRVDLRV